jgi:hypothetical protein
MFSRPPTAMVAAARRHDVVASGTAAGLAGGVVMMLLITVSAALAGMPALHPLGVIGASLLGPEALDGGPAHVAYGTILHVLVSCSFGVLFAAMIPRDFPVASAAMVGAGSAILIIGVMMSLVVPPINPMFRSEMQPIGGTWVIAHAAFGATLGLAPALRRRLSGAVADAREKARVSNVGSRVSTESTDRAKVPS